ncbi:hypothetical protein PR048_020207 [Dryococelus australis]|uniref:Uncharacterized protein n=1 Tax=Dryococelus australis TaxID=614101 RepID=A0ABQ9H5N3_9NEOP|nr:hypothetical protein PR048_020207 [Dryococelus australis]
MWQQIRPTIKPNRKIRFSKRQSVGQKLRKMPVGPSLQRIGALTMIARMKKLRSTCIVMNSGQHQLKAGQCAHLAKNGHTILVLGRTVTMMKLLMSGNYQREITLQAVKSHGRRGLKSKLPDPRNLIHPVINAFSFVWRRLAACLPNV